METCGSNIWQNLVCECLTIVLMLHVCTWLLSYSIPYDIGVLLWKSINKKLKRLS